MLLVILFIAVIYLGTLATAPSMRKAGVESSKIYMPFVNTWELVKLTGRPTYQAVLVYLPIFNFFLLFSFLTDLSRSFGQNTFGDYFKAMVIPMIHFKKIAVHNYIGKTTDLPKHQKSAVREWADSIVFAVLAATLIRWSTFEAFMIPTSSMEGTLMVGDYLFVSKIHYGPRSPITPLQVPLTHQNIWFTGNAEGTNGISSYLDWIELPYFRFPGLTEIERNDIVVFNFPWDNGKQAIPNLDLTVKNELRPTDLKTNYVKRCVALPGDTLEVRDKDIFINGENSNIEGVLQYQHTVKLNKKAFGLENKNKVIQLVKPKESPFTVGEEQLSHVDSVNQKLLDICDELNIRTEEERKFFYPGRIVSFVFNFRKATFDLSQFTANMTLEEAKKLEALEEISSVDRDLFKTPTTRLYPSEKAWTQNIYGPLVIPKKGMTFKVTPERLIMYEKALVYFEGDDIRISDDNQRLYVNRKQVSEYTFKQNYYYMIGDNRNGSYDSRFWAFVPEDHIVGTPLLVWLSVEDTPNKSFFERIRWNRIFTWVR